MSGGFAPDVITDGVDDVVLVLYMPSTHYLDSLVKPWFDRCPDPSIRDQFVQGKC